ncbi:MAG: hypothetical protein ACREX9_16845 [Gammaproteobacteria bacterium]
MSKPNKSAYDLTDAEKRDLIQLIQQGKPLPEQYRFILFEDKREVELVWTGKTREVCTTVLPFQSLEHVDEPRREAPESPQLGLFDTRGRQAQGLDQQAHLGRQQADPVVIEERRAAPADRGRGRPQAHLHRSALRRRRRFLHGY